MSKRAFTSIIAIVSSAIWLGLLALVWKHVGLTGDVMFAIPLAYLFAVAITGSWKLARRRESTSDFLVVLRRISGRHLKYHMLYPLAIGALLEFVFIFREQPIWLSRVALWNTLLKMGSLQHVVPVLGVVLTYLVLLYRFVIKAPLIQYHPANLSTVRDVLSEATGYFALSPVRLKDWFKPNSITYFSMLIENKRLAEQEKRNFEYERVVVFARDRDYNDAITQVLDLPYSRALGRLHGDFRIPLAFITQDEVARVLECIGQDGRPTLEGSTAWPPWAIETFKLYKRKPWIFHLDFALIYREKGNIVLVAPTQKEKAIVISDPSHVRVYEQVIAEIRKVIHDEQGKVLHNHNFLENISNQ